MKTFLSTAVFVIAIVCRNTPAYVAQDFGVQVEARISGMSIVVEWPQTGSDTVSDYTVWRKKSTETAFTQRDSAQMPIQVVGTTIYRFTDTGVSGSLWEYEVRRSITPQHPDKYGNSGGYGYVAIGHQYPNVIQSRGKVVLLVDRTIVQDDTVMQGLLRRLQADLVGDGWQVIRHDVDRGKKSYSLEPPTTETYDATAYKAQVQAMRDLIKTDYAGGQNGVTTVFLFGHVAVPYAGSATFAADGHPEHYGTWAADMYYGEMTAFNNWHDSATYTAPSNGKPWNSNAPNDGKWDDEFLPVYINQNNVAEQKLELAVGRVDFKEFLKPDWNNKTENDLLKAYLEKDHNYRMGAFNSTIRRKALINDMVGVQEDTGRNGTWPPSAMAWRSFPALFKRANVDSVGDRLFLPQVRQYSYLWSAVFSDSPGDFRALNKLEPTRGTQQDPIDYTYSTEFGVSDIKVVFTSFIGSYVGDWDNQNNFLRGPLGSATYSLVSIWGGAQQWFLHPMGIGATIGDCMLTNVNNNDTPRLYKAQGQEDPSRTYIAIMGDPTLRLDIVKPIRNLRMTFSGANVVLNWDPSGENLPYGVFAGYNIYKATSSSGPFTYLANTFSTNFSEPRATSGNIVYMVKAAKWEGYDAPTELGSYLNTSVGIITPAYTLTPFFPGSSTSYAYANNNAGKTVGSGEWSANQHALIKVPGSAATFLEQTLFKSEAFAISDTDCVVGSYRTSGTGNQSRAFQWTQAGGLLQLAQLPSAGSINEATAITVLSGPVTVIAGNAFNSFGVSRAVRWRSDNSYAAQDMWTLGGSGTSFDSYAYGINAFNKVVGKSRIANGVNVHAFAASGATISSTDDLGTATGSDSHYSEAQAINNFDEIVGASTMGNGQYRAFFKTGVVKNQNFIDLGILDAGDLSTAYSINNLGEVVGSSRTTTSSGSERAFIYRKGWNSMQKLENYIPANTGFTLVTASSINDAGQIVGWGYWEELPMGFVLDPN